MDLANNKQSYLIPKEPNSYFNHTSKNVSNMRFFPNFNESTYSKKDTQRKKFTEEDYPSGGMPTQKKLAFTPLRKEEENFESKQTLNNFSFPILKDFQQPRGQIKNNFNNYDSNESNKENSSLRSNSNLTNGSILNSIFSSENRKDMFSSNSGFKIPAKKSIIPEETENKNQFNMIKKNLQLSFTNRDSSVLFENQNRNYTTTIISNSNSSSASQNFENSRNSQNFEISQENFSDSEISIENSNFNQEKTKILWGDTQSTKNSQRNQFLPPEISESQKTISESLLENFNNKSILIPREKKNDENYKLLAIKKVRKHIFKHNKSTSHNDVLMDCEPTSMLECKMFTEKRKKLAHSVKKVYASEIFLTDPLTNQKHSFRIYQDVDIGMTSQWQQYIRTSQGDEDVPSDEEQIQRAERHNLEEFGQALHAIFVEKRHDLIQNLPMRKFS